MAVARLSSAAPATTSATAPTALLGDGDLSVFFPAGTRDSNAAAAYTRAFEIFAADRDRLKYRDQWDVLLQRRSLRAALDQIASGTLCRSCDFLPFLPDDLSRSTKFPYLLDTQELARLLAARADRELTANQRESALATARTLMAFGRHLRASALVLTQEVQGVAIERLAVSWFRKAYGPKADAATSAKLNVVARLLDGAQEFVADAVTSHSAKGESGFPEDLAWLRSPVSVLRCEAILNMAQATLPPSVLVKPTPGIDLSSFLQKISQATTASKVQIRRDEVEARIQWPRKGVRGEVTAADVRRLREALAPIAQSDPEPRVRVLAQRLLDALVEPKPLPPPPVRPTTATRTIPPPPRPPRLPAPGR
jgi:hypothetical protein